MTEIDEALETIFDWIPWYIMDDDETDKCRAAFATVKAELEDQAYHRRNLVDRAVKAEVELDTARFALKELSKQNASKRSENVIYVKQINELKAELARLRDQLMWFEWYERLGSNEEKRAMAAFDIAAERDEAVAALREAERVLLLADAMIDPTCSVREQRGRIGRYLLARARLTPKEPTDD